MWDQDPSDLSDDDLAALLEALRAEELRRLGDPEGAPKRRRFFQETEKLASLGVLVRGLAHEFNNLFSGIIAHCDYALQSDDADARQRALEVALASTRTASATVKNLQRFARQQRLRFAKEDPVALCRRTIQLLLPSLKTHDVRVRESLEPVAPFVMDAGGVQQVLVNLLTNAMQASPAGAEVGVGLRREGERCVLEVRDRGPGIPEELQDRIFVPFFSTKGVYARSDREQTMTGTGLGLSASYGIVRRHGGTIEIETGPEAGTTIRVKLPMSRKVTLPSKVGGRPEREDYIAETRRTRGRAEKSRTPEGRPGS